MPRIVKHLKINLENKTQKPALLLWLNSALRDLCLNFPHLIVGLCCAEANSLLPLWAEGLRFGMLLGGAELAEMK